MKEKARKGFAVIKPHIVKQIASMGGTALYRKRGGKWMARIGRVGGKR